MTAYRSMLVSAFTPFCCMFAWVVQIWLVISKQVIACEMIYINFKMPKHLPMTGH